MDAAYFKAAIPEPYTIFGVRLLPLSIGRYRILKRFDCAFVSEEEAKATFEDLMLGILVCSMPTKEFLDFIESERFSEELSRLGERIRKEVDHDRYFNLLEKYGLFQAYIAESSRCPKYWDEQEDNPDASPSHWSHNLEMVLRSECNYSSEEIEEGPISKALADYFKYAENQGTIRLMSEQEEAQAAENERVFLAMMGGGKAWGSN